MQLLLILTLCLGIFPIIVLGLTPKEFLTITRTQRDKLDTLRTRTAGKVVHDYMKEDIFLLTFLRNSKFNLDVAERKILAYLKWREENEVDKVIHEKFPEYDEEYRMVYTGCDKEANPVLIIPFGEWDVRKVALAGKGNELIRYFQKLLEEGTGIMRWGQKEGFLMTQATLIFDLKGVNINTHYCSTCVPIFLKIYSFMGNHYAGLASRVHVVNAPDFAVPFINIFKGVLDPSIADILQVSGTSRTQIADKVGRDVSLAELDKRVGGEKRVDGVDMSSLRNVAPDGFLADPKFLDLKGKNITDFCDLGEWPRIEKLIRAIFPNNNRLLDH